MRLAYPGGKHKINYRNILAQYMDNVKWLDTRFCIKHTLPVKSALPAAGLFFSVIIWISWKPATIWSFIITPCFLFHALQLLHGFCDDLPFSCLPGCFF